MKKLRIVALILVLAAMLSMSVVAIENDNATVTPETITGANTTVEFANNGDSIKVTVTGSALEAGKQYVVLMVKCAEGEDYTIDTNSILYIDQAAATASGSEGTITFDVYPTSLADSVILIAGADGGPLKVAIVKGKYVLGDADGSGGFDISDAIAVLRVVAELDDISEINQTAADVDGFDGVDIGDAIAMLRVVAELQETFR